MKKEMIKTVAIAGVLMPLFAEAHVGHTHGTVEAKTIHTILLIAGLVAVAVTAILVKKTKNAQLKRERASNRNLHV